VKLDGSSFLEKNKDLNQLSNGEQKIYYVGGAVRDLVLGRENKDIDLLCEKETFKVARQWAAMKHGSFYILDDERGTARVILSQNGNRLVYDFARQQGETLLADLSARDFTINAMAIDLDDLGTVIDPLNGQKDLAEKKLRCCSESSFSIDPVRVIRAFRYAAAYDLRIMEETRVLLRNSISGLEAISPERKRDEFFKLLDLDDPIPAVIQMRKESVLRQLGIPDTDKVEYGIASFIALFFNGKEVFGNGISDEAVQVLIRQYLESRQIRNTSERNLRQLLLFYSLIMDSEIESIENISQQLLLTNDEIQHVTTLKQNRIETLSLLSKGEGISRRELYQFFSRTNSAGLDLCLIAIAEANSTQQKELFTLASGKIFDTWFNHPEVVNPVLLLTGKDLMFTFDLTPGPAIGKLLALLKEEQAAGTISDRQQAVEWLEPFVNSIKNQQYWEDRS
jgi:tRNA nucleotidyltransferase/poly(A) polymerase